MLNAAGFEVVVACDGREAVRLAQETEPDLVVLDIQMPEMDGYAACEQILQNQGSIPIVFLTREPGTHLSALGDQLGAYLPKPAREATFIATIRSLLERAATQTC